MQLHPATHRVGQSNSRKHTFWLFCKANAVFLQFIGVRKDKIVADGQCFGILKDFELMDPSLKLNFLDSLSHWYLKARCPSIAASCILFMQGCRIICPKKLLPKPEMKMLTYYLLVYFFLRITSSSNSKWWAWPPRQEPPTPPWPPRPPPQSNRYARVLLPRLPLSASSPRPPISCPSVQPLRLLLRLKHDRRAGISSSHQSPATAAGSTGPGSCPSKTTLPRACPTSRVLSGKARVHREPQVRALSSHHSNSLSNSSTCSNPQWANR